MKYLQGDSAVNLNKVIYFFLKDNNVTFVFENTPQLQINFTNPTEAREAFEKLWKQYVDLPK